jgi:alkylhydroperoxidase family enzyme
MAFIREIPLDELSDQARELYETNQAKLGYVPNYLKAFAHRPEVLSAWGQLLGAIRGNMDQRRYELATLAAAGALRSTYCMLAHSTALLRRQIFTPGYRARGRRPLLLQQDSRRRRGRG